MTTKFDENFELKSNFLKFTSFCFKIKWFFFLVEPDLLKGCPGGVYSAKLAIQHLRKTFIWWIKKGLIFKFIENKRSFEAEALK